MKKLSDARIAEIIARHRPKGITLRWKKRLVWSRKQVFGSNTPFRPAHACSVRKEVYAANPADFLRDTDRRRALAYVLHEFGHFHCGKGDHHETAKHIPLHVVEYEAEMWGHAVMRLEGITIPREELRSAKLYVSWCIQQDKKRVRLRPKIRRHIREWARRPVRKTKKANG